MMMIWGRDCRPFSPGWQRRQQQQQQQQRQHQHQHRQRRQDRRPRVKRGVSSRAQLAHDTFDVRRSCCASLRVYGRASVLSAPVRCRLARRIGASPLALVTTAHLHCCFTLCTAPAKQQQQSDASRSPPKAAPKHTLPPAGLHDG
jgi:hypothetical protein